MSKKTETKLEFLGLAGINPHITNVSSPRAVMDFSHTSSRPSLIDPDDPIVKTGIEYELGNYIQDVKTEHDCVVKAIIPKLRGYNDSLNTETILIVEYEKNGEVWLDMIEAPEYRSNHNFFGFRLHPTEVFQNLHYNAPIPKDTILARTDSYGPDGVYQYGVNANVAFMSHPSVAEDGIVVSRSFCHKLRFTAVTKRIINITKETIPVNVNGNQSVFKFLPNIGEPVREDGLLCATRPRNDWFSIVDLNNQSISENDSTFDNPVYVPPGSVVVDIKVVRGNYGKSEFSQQMTAQLDEYAELQINYNRNVVSQYEKILAEKKSMYGSIDEIRQTGRLRRYIADCMILINAASTGKTKLCYRKLPIDQYRVEVTVMAVITPREGFKLTDIDASKGVITLVLPDEEMPVDENGVRADMITDSSSTISRMNNGRAYHHYLGATSRDNRMRLINYYSNKNGPNWFNMFSAEDVEYGIQYLRGLYERINPDMVEFIDRLNYAEQLNHLQECLGRQITIYFPPDNAINIVDVIANLENCPYKPHLGKVKYVDGFGNLVTTEEDVRIGNMTVIALEKVAMDGSAVSSARVNSFNFPIKGSNADKHKYPHNLTPTTTLSETEVRILRAFADPVLIAELIDLTLNPVSHKLLVKEILEDNKAYSTDHEIPRDVVDYGQTKSLLLLRHIFNACGFDFEYAPEENGDEEGGLM